MGYNMVPVKPGAFITLPMQPTVQPEHPIHSLTPRSSYHSRPPQQPPRPSMVSSQAPSLPPPHPHQTQSSVYQGMGVSKLQQQRNNLKRVRYINQLARLDYEEKAEEIHTKYTRVSRASVVKKMKARNMIAEFEEEEAEEELGMEELLEFKYGRSGDGVYFEREAMQEHCFCPDCDAIHNDHPEAHTRICIKARAEDPELYSPYSPDYPRHSLGRIREQVGRIKDQQYQELFELLGRNEGGRWREELCELQDRCQGDAILGPLLGKVMGLVQSSQYRQ